MQLQYKIYILTCTSQTIWRAAMIGKTNVNLGPGSPFRYDSDKYPWTLEDDRAA